MLNKKQIIEFISEQLGVNKDACTPNDLLCTDCGGEMKHRDAPTRHVLFKIPFTEIYLELWNWGHRELFCLECTLEKASDRQRQIYDAGKRDGYEKGYDDAHRA